MPAFLARLEARTLLVLALAAAALWGFGALADGMLDGDTHALDERLLLALRNPADLSDPLGPGVVETMMRDLTALGGAVILVLLIVGATLALVFRGQPRSALLLLAAVAGAQALSTGTKALFARPRPDLVPHGTDALLASFPSGHSTMAAATYLILAAMLARAEPRRRAKALYIALAAVIVLGVGVSRVYLGVHWPSDVLAGWALGSAWALLCFLAAEWLGRRGDIEPERERGEAEPDARPATSFPSHSRRP